MDGKKLFYSILCGAGGGMMGFCASRLNTVSGAFLFAAGAGLLFFSMVRLMK